MTDRGTEISRESLEELLEEMSRLETLEAACQGALAEDRHVSFFAGPFEKSLRAVRRDMTQLIEKMGAALDHPAERSA